MPYADSNGVRIYYEETGCGSPLLFLHELAGDHLSWEPQVRHHSRNYHCITFAARGYPPSSIPDDLDSYSQDLAADDAIAVLDALGIETAHLIGLSMGGFAALHVGLRYPDRARSLMIAGCGYGAEPERLEQGRDEARALADRLDEEGMARFAEFYANGPFRLPFKRKDVRGWNEFKDRLAERSPLGISLTLRGILARRPSLWHLESELRALTMPVLIATGDEDEPCLAPDLYLKKTIPRAALWVMPKTGHTLNLEEPASFNEELARFLAVVECESCK